MVKQAIVGYKMCFDVAARCRTSKQNHLPTTSPPAPSTDKACNSVNLVATPSTGLYASRAVWECSKLAASPTPSPP